MSSIKTYTTTVTPQMAAEWLKKNTTNRRVRKSHVDFLSGCIQRGEWLLTHQGIAFSPTGHLLDGQHRLLAIVATNIAVPMMVSLGVPDGAFDAIDVQHVARSKSDLLKVTTAEAAVATLAWKVHHDVWGGSAVSVAQMRAYSDVFTPLVRRLEDGAPPGTTLLTNSKVRLAAVLACECGDGYEYVRPLYADFISRDYRNLPPVALSMIRRIDMREFRSSSTDPALLVYARRMFDVSHRDFSKLQVKDMRSRTAQIANEVHYVMARAEEMTESA